MKCYRNPLEYGYRICCRTNYANKPQQQIKGFFLQLQHSSPVALRHALCSCGYKVLRSTVSTCTPYLVRGEPTGPILKGITYMVRPAERTHRSTNNTLVGLFIPTTGSIVSMATDDGFTLGQRYQKLFFPRSTLWSLRQLDS